MRRNQYEKAFASWLGDNGVEYVPVDQQKRAVFARSRIKSFDFLVYPKTADNNHRSNSSRRDVFNAVPAIVEIKGKLFKGSSLKNLTGLQNWVTTADIRGLTAWEDSFDGPQPFKAVFVFVYRLQYPYAETGPYHTYEYDGEKFFFLAVSLADYKKNMTVRSKSWQTVSLGAADFRSVARPGYRIFCRTDEYERDHNQNCRVCS
jgi:hypothetical protein